MSPTEKMFERAESVLVRLEKLLPAESVPTEWKKSIAFRWRKRNGQGAIQSVNHVHKISLADLRGIDRQKKIVEQNTRQFVEGYPAKPRCINTVGLKRNNFPAHVIQSLSEAHRLLYRAKVGLDNAWEILRNNGQLVPQVNHLLSFVQDQHEGMHGRGRERRRAA